MKRQRTIIITVCVLLCLLALLAVNRDLCQYKFVYPYAREFADSYSTKGFTAIYDEITLKPAVYQIFYEGESQGKENGISIQDFNGNILVEQLFPEGPFQETAELKIEGSARQVRLGVLFAGGESKLRVDRITVNSSHVLYRDSLLRHLTISAGILLLSVLLILRFCYPDFWAKHVPMILQDENERSLLFLLLMALVSCYPLMIPDTYLLADDSQFHFSRIEGITEAIRAGEFPARIHLFYLQDYGYGNGFFYPQLWLYIPVVFRLLGFPVMTTYTIFMVLCSFLSTAFTYGCTKHISGKNSSGIIAGLLSCFASYRLIDGLFRGALGEIQAFVFLPLIIWAVYDIFCLKKDNWLLLSAGFGGLLGSHLISLAMTGILFLVFLLGCLCCGKLKKRELVSIIKAGGVTILLGAFFFLPFWEQLQHTNLKVKFLVSSGTGEIKQYAILPWKCLFQIFLTWWQKDIPSRPWPGLPLLFVLLCLIIPVKHSSYAIKSARILGIISLFSLWTSTNLFPWESFNWLFSRVQFSWRFLLIPTSLLPIAGGILFPEILSFLSEKILITCVLMVSLLFAGPIFNDTVQVHMIETPQYILTNNRICNGEYMPVNLKRTYPDKNQDTVKYADEALDIQNQDRRGLSFTFEFALDELQENAVLEIPLTFYYGYQAEFRLEDGSVLSMPVVEGPNGLTALRDFPAASGTVRVYYQKTDIQRISEIISLITLAGVSAWIIIQRRRKLPLAPSFGE